MKKLPFKKTEIILLGIIALYVLSGFAMSWSFGTLDNFQPLMYKNTSILATTALLILYGVYRFLKLLYIMIFIRPRKLFAYLGNDFREGPLNPERYIRALPVFITIVLLFSVFTSLKSMIPYINPFSWDETFATTDRLIHLGVDPWEITHSLFGSPVATKFINQIYNFWLWIMYLILYWQLFSLKDPQTRMQFFYTFVFCWIVNGSLLAFFFSSAGPCFYEQVIGSDYFEPLMSTLTNIDAAETLWAVGTQQMLWAKHMSGEIDVGVGISAMPSLHVATALIFVFLAWRTKNTLWKTLSVLYYASILIGSVHLGWHYAIDGYLSSLVTVGIWFGAGRALRYIEKPNDS